MKEEPVPEMEAKGPGWQLWDVRGQPYTISDHRDFSQHKYSQAESSDQVMRL